MERSELVRTLLLQRGFTSEDVIQEFLEPDYELHTHSPLLLHDMEKAVSRVREAIEREERIAVYADFDCDGIPGAALMSDFFSRIGYAHVEVYIPHRDREGYGFHQEAVARLAERGVKLIITIDVGASAASTVSAANELGVDVIVTDHHELPAAPHGEMPDAVAIVHPKVGDTYPYRDLCGAAVAFKLVQALIMDGRARGDAAYMVLPLGWEKWLLDMVALATIADMVPLTGENRVLARFGLSVLRKSPRLGLRALFSRLRMRQEEVTEEDVGFSIAPRINAASRMDNPELAFKLLTTGDATEAANLAARLEELNASRKGVVGAVVREARKRVRERFSADERVIVLGSPEWKPALLGLAANSIIEDRGGVVCLWGRDAQGRIKGSCRSDGSISVVELFQHTNGALLEYGGHAMSGGFSVSSEAVHTLHKTVAAAAESLPKRAAEDTEGTRAHDAEVSVRGVTRTLLADISRLAPFGIGNPKPIFFIACARITDVRLFGKERNHVELELECTESGARLRAFDFFRTPEKFTQTPNRGETASVLGTVERDSYRGGLVLRLVDVLPV